MPIRSKARKPGKQPVRKAGPRAADIDGSEGLGNPDKPRTRKTKKRRKGKEGAGKPEQRPAATASSGVADRPAPAKTSESYAPGFVDGEYQDGGVRGRVFLLGLPNSGKTFLLCRRIRTCRRVIVFDPVNADTLAPLLSEGFLHVHQPDQLRDAIAATWGGDFRIMYSPTSGDGFAHFEAVNAIVKFAGDCVYAVDEVDKFQEPGYAPPQLYELLNYGRHAHVAMIGTARRPAQVSKEYTYGLSEICAFATTEPGDLDYLEKKIGWEASSKVPTLGKYEYLRWLQTGEAAIGKGWE